ncbi:MAG TPA: acetyl-CoA carboxylase biotin carboxyl carrier protein [Blastocatellia bacterium]|nr:acetyl-CoA carboxylase biotin carboxyl carrier protein [Blastocatellia bacterium]
MTKHKTTTTTAANPGKAQGHTDSDPPPKSVENEAGKYPSLLEIKELIEFVSKKEFNEFELERGEFRLRWRKGTPEPAAPLNRTPANLSQPAAENRPVEQPSASLPATAPASAPQEEKLHIVTSPIVGTFYRSPSPTAEAFVKLGDTVEAGKTLCIIEAMKLMNEIPSDAGGTIAKVFVENGQPVEYGQPLFGIKV